MKLPKIDTDDLLLFGSLVVMSLGLGMIVGATTESVLLGVGVGLAALGVPSAVVAFLAAAEVETK